MHGSRDLTLQLQDEISSQKVLNPICPVALVSYFSWLIFSQILSKMFLDTFYGIHVLTFALLLHFMEILREQPILSVSSRVTDTMVSLKEQLMTLVAKIVFQDS